MLKDYVLEWLRREVPLRGSNLVSSMSSVLATDIGLSRKENQDRVIAMRCAPSGRNGHAVFILADGMGGMRDGAHCASLALATFVESYISGHGLTISQRLLQATFSANDQVYQFAAGSGGSTLSVFAIDSNAEAYVVNVGDSRTFLFERGMPIQRLTVDDSLAEAVGGHGRELLQFIGMGEGIQPHIDKCSLGKGSILITSDGVHYIEQAFLETVVNLAPSTKAAADRLMALSRWCGGPDNASLIALDPAAIVQNLSSVGSAIDLWDAHSTLQIVIVQQQSAENKPPLVDRSGEREDAVEKSSASRKRKTGRAKRGYGGTAKADKKDDKNIQLEIDVEVTPDRSSENADR